MGNANSGRLISIELVQRVERLLLHLPQSQVADVVGIDLGTVQKVQRGEHPHQRALRTAHRCPGCGGKLVVAECLKCKLDAERAQHNAITAGLHRFDGEIYPLVSAAMIAEAAEAQEQLPDKPRARAA